MENNEKFEYTYSAQKQEEIESIRRKYLPQEEDKMEKLRRLDKSVEQKATIISIIVGIVGTLIMGFGMCMCIEWSEYISGIIIGITGIVVIVTAYPIYQYVLKKQRKKITPEILRLTDEISNIRS
ncbi:MAG: hypothetical protein K2L10_02655 [Ruminococcus sp.]|nr:hypothetical protein [Ruminococcus sp.]